MARPNFARSDWAHGEVRRGGRMHSVADLVETIRKFEPGKPLKAYIGHIRFPNFKNIEPDTEI